MRNYTTVLDKNKADTDGDGLSDYEEVKIYNNLGVKPLLADTDDDGLNDYEEVKIYHTKPAKADSDYDGLSDYAEIFTYHTDPNKYSSDNDTLSDAMEVLVTHTDPWKDDTDNDGLNDSTEYQNGLNPLSNDTDSDQWLDGVEYHYWLSHGWNSAQAYANCKNPDVDGDGITDYQEVYGYTVKVATSFDQNGNPIMQEKTMYGDPLQAYKQAGGARTDTDGDGIPDIVEIYFSNTTNIDNETMWQEYLKNTATGSLFQRYTWCRDYYHDLNASNSSAAENWTQKAFNPFVVCNLPPMITTFSAEVHEYGEWNNKRYTIQTQFVVKDLRGVAEVKQELYELVTGKLYASHTYNPGAGYTVITAGWEFDVDYWTLKAYGYNVRGTVKGESGLSVSAEQKISGLVTMVVDAIMALGAMLLGGLQKVWEAVQNAVNAIVEWIKQQITAGLQIIIAPVQQAINAYIENLITALSAAYDEYLSTGSISEKNLSAVRDALMGGVWWALVALSVGLAVILTVLLPVTMPIGIVTSIVLPLITGIIIGAFLAGKEVGRKEISVSPEWKIAEIVAFAKALVESGEKISTKGGKWDTLFGFMGALLGWQGFVVGLFAPLYAGYIEPTRYLIAGFCVVVSVLSLILGLATPYYTGTTELLIGGLSLIFGVMGIVSGLVATTGEIPVPLYMGGTGLLLGILGTIFTLASVFW